MALLSNRTAEEELANNLVKENQKNLKRFLGNSGIMHLKNVLIEIGQKQDINAMHSYMQYTLNRINYITNKKEEYEFEAKLADNVYKSYITDGISRLEKINGRFLASQTIKLDMMIEQNNHIIQLLEQIVSLLNSTNQNNNLINYTNDSQELNNQEEIDRWRQLQEQGIITKEELQQKLKELHQIN